MPSVQELGQQQRAAGVSVSHFMKTFIPTTVCLFFRTQVELLHNHGMTSRLTSRTSQLKVSLFVPVAQPYSSIIH